MHAAMKSVTRSADFELDIVSSVMAVQRRCPGARRVNIREYPGLDIDSSKTYARERGLCLACVPLRNGEDVGENSKLGVTTERQRVNHLFDQSDQLAGELLAVIDLPVTLDTTRVDMSRVACSLSLEHWHSARILLRQGLLPSALVVHRAQFESVTRSIWLAYAASDDNVSKFGFELSLEAEQAAKNAPMVNEMLQEINRKAPRPAFDALARFKDNSWKALNSYAHAGIHPLRRHRDGYPIALIESVLCNANGIAVLSCMQAVVLGGRQSLQRAVLEVAGKHAKCMPPSL